MGDIIPNVEIGQETGNPVGTPPLKPEEVDALANRKTILESEISGLEGTKTSILSDIQRLRGERKNPEVVPPVVVETPPAPPVDIEAIKKELDEKHQKDIAAALAPILENQAKMTQDLINSKKVIVQNITERMASASGSGGPASPESIVGEEVELSDEQKKIVVELGIKNPRYLQEAEVN